MKPSPVVFAAIIGSLFFCQVVYGQFVPYSQYNNVQLLTNPAFPSLTKYTQVTVHYRKSRVGNYDLPSVSFMHPFYRRSDGLQYGGVGVNVISQHAGPGGIYKVTGASGVFAYVIHLSRKHHVGAGIAAGVINKRIDVSGITTDSQYNLGTYDPSLSNGETFQLSSVTRPVINAGLRWVLTGFNNQEKASFGIGAYNMNKPAFDLFANSPADDMTYIAAGEIALVTRGRFTLSPTFRYVWQGTSIANIGSRISYRVNNDNELSTGVWYKTTGGLVFSAQYNAKRYIISASTDLSIASGRDANINNALEIGLGWRMKRKVELKPRNTAVGGETIREPKAAKSSPTRVSRNAPPFAHYNSTDSSRVESEEVESLPDTPAIYFDVVSAEVPTDRTPFLEDLASALKRDPKLKLKIAGHRSTEEDQSVNKQISYKRAKAVAKILIDYEVSEGQLKVIDMGVRKPVGSNRTKAGRQKNRRVDFEWIKN
ncbi:PorP/SprF family type IX secretion system membrane protein [Chryseolinea sp. H1M3-3]|uniref:PorP/SprF family type IX secretion system membrane protein n=1 Tax=Chryseolinea sp. H1M3-3 TaxID=3034144 RepID=UPI0023ED3C47|nr:PorP/SprF family type IX secretion system membrane protein [Chryseolinea sp. H1M3-3]